MVAMGEPDPCREPLPRESRYLPSDSDAELAERENYTFGIEICTALYCKWSRNALPVPILPSCHGKPPTS